MGDNPKEAVDEEEGKDAREGGNDFKVKEEDGPEDYEGEKRDGKKNGKGRLVFKYGMYEGQWENNMMSGPGKLELKSGNVYEGMFKNNKFEGQGTLRWRNGKVYEGEMKNGNMCGRGTMSSEDGVYEGGFFDNDYYGTGRMRFANGCVYEGEWKLGMMWGEGKLQTGSGVTFEGEFYKNQKHGKVIKTDAKNEYSETYNRDNLETSFKLKKSSKGGVGKFLSKVTNSIKHGKEGKDKALFSRPKQTKEEVAKQLDKRAKNNQYHKGGGVIGDHAERGERAERSGYASHPRSPRMKVPDPVHTPAAKPEPVQQQRRYSSPEASPTDTGMAPPPLPPCPPPPSDHFVTLQQR